jgi:type IV pilus assembly protein PilX
MIAIKNKQQGAALLVSLILLLIMTLVGISAIDSVTMQSQMARNAKFSQDCYQLALSEIEANSRKTSATNPEGFSERIQQVTIEDTIIPFLDAEYKMQDLANDLSMNLTANAIYKGEGTRWDGSGEVTGLKFEINSNCIVAGGGGSNQTQGINVPSPKSET